MTNPSTSHPGWRVQIAIHRAVRRDLRRLSAAMPGNHDRLPAIIGDYWSVTNTQLREHHLLEDGLIWPLMRQRLGGRVDAVLDRNEAEHGANTAAMDAFTSAVSATSADATVARAALAQLDDTIEKHLGHEEADVLPLIPEAFTADDVLFFSAEAMKTNPPQVFLPWLLDEAPNDDVAFFMAPMPPSLRYDLESSWTPPWRMRVEALRRSAAIRIGR
jgi:iron-sulfur cluster repair protein YtfE (RIC family)